MSEKYIKCQVTTHRLAGHDYTILLDGDGNKYLKLEKFDLGNSWEPKLYPDSPANSFGDSKALKYSQITAPSQKGGDE